MVKASKKYYTYELREDPDTWKPMSMRVITKTYRYPVATSSYLKAGDIVVIKGNGNKLIARVFGFASKQGNEARQMLLIAQDGYIWLDLVTSGNNILKVYKDGKYVPVKRKIVKDSTQSNSMTKGETKMKTIKVRFTSSASSAAIASGDEWFKGLTKKQQADYIKLHPRSKFAKNAGATPKADSTNKKKSAKDFGPKQRPSWPSEPKKNYKDEKRPEANKEKVKVDKSPKAKRAVVKPEAKPVVVKPAPKPKKPSFAPSDKDTKSIKKAKDVLNALRVKRDRIMEQYKTAKDAKVKNSLREKFAQAKAAIKKQKDQIRIILKNEKKAIQNKRRKP
jgi:hypothetical protein